jgi:hypothetical protein
MKRLSVLILAVSSLLSFDNQTLAYEGEVHFKICEAAADASRLAFFLRNHLGMEEGIDTKIRSGNLLKPVWEWIAFGGEAEDFGYLGKHNPTTTRAYNHFHDPLKDWDEAGLKNTTAELLYHGSYFRLPVSAVLWGLKPGEQDFKSNFTGDWSWGKAREYYYDALTRPTEKERQGNLADCFRALGQALHLLQDMSVPLHTRNDVHIFPLIESMEIGPNRWTYETYAKKNIETLDFVPDQPGDRPPGLLLANPQAQSEPADYTDLPPVSGLFDRNVYVNGAPIPNNTDPVGLAEYSNANFLTFDTMWKYPHPALSNTNFYETVWSNQEEVIAEDGQIDKRIYLRLKEGVGAGIEHLAAAEYFAMDYQGYEEMSTLFSLDEECWKDYAEKLIPRAVGYSAALLDYFFRGLIEITLPETGAYAIIQDPDPSPGKGFTRVSLLAENVTDEGEEMTDGSIELVVMYRLSLADPFRNYDEPVPTTEEFFYILAPEAKGVRGIPRDGAVKLDFDLEDNPIPLWATDVYLQVVYRGRLGLEEGAVAVGLKDIFEPTPMDIINNMDKVCIHGKWLDAGSAEAIAAVDRDEPGEAGHGIADPEEWDVYPHDLKNLYLAFFPVSDCRYPSCTDEDLKIAYIEAGDYVRVFLLTDERYCMSHCAVSIVHTHPDDRFGYNYFGAKASSFPGLKNQTEMETDPGVCGQCGLEAPCELRYYPAFRFLKGVERWNRYFFDNAPYPPGSSCSYDQLP